MIVIVCRAQLPQLGIANTFRIALPDDTTRVGKRLPYVICLHDYGQNGERLLRENRWEAAVEQNRTAILFPDGQNSCFMNMAFGPAWENYLLEGLIPYAERMFPLHGRPGLLGVGMGGWAAARLAAKYPERFGVSAAANARRDLQQAYAVGELGEQPDLEAVFGDPAAKAFPLCEKTAWLNGLDALGNALMYILRNDRSTNG